MAEKAGLINVKLRVIKPLGQDKQRPTHYFLAVVGTGLQQGCNDPSKGQRALYIGDHVWERDIWVPKNTDISYKWLVVQYYTNDIKDIETLPPRKVNVGDKSLAITNRFNVTDVTITEMDSTSKPNDKGRGTNKPRKNYNIARYSSSQRKDFSDKTKPCEASSATSAGELEAGQSRGADDSFDVSVPNTSLHVKATPTKKPGEQSAEDSYVEINTRITDVKVHGENVQVEIQGKPGGPSIRAGPPDPEITLSAELFRTALTECEREQRVPKTSCFKRVVKTVAFLGAVAAGANLAYSCYKYHDGEFKLSNIRLTNPFQTTVSTIALNTSK